MSIHAKAGAYEPSLAVRCEHAVLKHTAGERDHLEPGARPNRHAHVGDHVGQRGVESPGDPRRDHATSEVPRHATDDGACIHDQRFAARLDRAFVPAVGSGLAGQPFELHRSLPFVTDAVVPERDRGDGIEQPSNTRRQRHVQAAADHTFHDRGGGRVDPCAQHRGIFTGVQQVRQPHSPRFAHGLIAAWHGHGSEKRRARHAT